MKGTVTEIKNNLQVINSRVDAAEKSNQLFGRQESRKHPITTVKRKKNPKQK